MILNVNATRMELTRLKKEYRIAVGGHKLLKDKRDEMMRQFLIIARECRDLRREIQEAVGEVDKGFAMSSAIMGKKEFKTSLLMGGREISLSVSKKNVMSVPIPVFSYEKTNNPPSCSEDFAAPELNESIELLDSYKDKIIHLAELEGAVSMLAAELEKTRRRVNSLEYVMIPNYRDTIKFIKMKIEENDRSNTTRLLKVKDMMVAENIAAKQNEA